MIAIQREQREKTPDCGAWKAAVSPKKRLAGLSGARSASKKRHGTDWRLTTGPRGDKQHAALNDDGNCQGVPVLMSERRATGCWTGFMLCLVAYCLLLIVNC